MKIGLITSRGGHLFQVYQLRDWWSCYERFWITDKGGDSDYLLKGEKVYYGYFPESRNIINAIRNFFLGWQILKKEKPNLLFSCGAGIAPPVFLAAKFLGCKLIFMEPYDFIKFPSLSGRLLSRFVDKFLVQQTCQKKFFKKAEFWGGTL
jgi:beta-1,4-N-acetylglucosaminyltransferase